MGGGEKEVKGKCRGLQIWKIEKPRVCVCVKRERQNADSRNYKFYVRFIQHGTLKTTSVPLHWTDRRRSSKPNDLGPLFF